jgi:hypothetical protein
MIQETLKVWKLSSEIDAFMKDWMVFHILIVDGKHCAYYRLNSVLPYLRDSGTVLQIVMYISSLLEIRNHSPTSRLWGSPWGSGLLYALPAPLCVVRGNRMRTRKDSVRIYSPYPLVKRLNEGDPSDETRKTENVSQYEGCSEVIETLSLTSLKYPINLWNFTKSLQRI